MKAKSAFPNAGQTLWIHGARRACLIIRSYATGIGFADSSKIPAMGETMGVAGRRKVILTQSVPKK